jgi:hypothetical protein
MEMDFLEMRYKGSSNNNLRRVKKISALFAIALTILFLSACEKDDICVEGDTPLLVIEFYDINDRDLVKQVTDLRVVGVGKDTTVNTVSDRADLDMIEIPLQIDSTSTSYLLISNSASNDSGEETGNVDTITFNYQTQEVFVSRACGFVANFDALGQELLADTDNWIQEVEIVQTLVYDQATAHVKIYH